MNGTEIFNALAWILGTGTVLMMLFVIVQAVNYAKYAAFVRAELGERYKDAFDELIVVDYFRQGKHPNSTAFLLKQRWIQLYENTNVPIV